MESLTSNQPIDQFTSNEAMQLLVIHHRHPEYNIALTKDEVKHLELSVIDDHENLSPAYLRMLITKDKLELLTAMSHNEEYML